MDNVLQNKGSLELFKVLETRLEYTMMSVLHLEFKVSGLVLFCQSHL